MVNLRNGVDTPMKRSEIELEVASLVAVGKSLLRARGKMMGTSVRVTAMYEVTTVERCDDGGCSTE